MHIYHVSYRTPDGETRECRVYGRNHVEATAGLVEAGMSEIEILARDPGRSAHLGRSSRSLVFALAIGIPVGLAAFWWFARRLL